MLWILIRKELLHHLLTLRLGVAFIITIVLVVLTTFIGRVDYSLRLESYGDEVKSIREAMDQATVYSQVEPAIVLSPQPLSIFCLGVDKSVGSRIDIEHDNIPLSPLRSSFHTNDSNLIKTLVQVDFTLVVTLVLSFLAVALGFDGICGERERGTLAQLLTNPIPRGTIIAAKLVGGWPCGSPWL
jgi:ABC-type transport system involved in multi-copper enzyme maturation permease subunit